MSGEFVAICVAPFVPTTRLEFAQLVVFKLAFCCNTNPVNDEGHERIASDPASEMLSVGGLVGLVAKTCARRNGVGSKDAILVVRDGGDVDYDIMLKSRPV